jgi:CRP-like cAMP-binding protein
MADSLIDWMRNRGSRRSVRAGVTLAYRGTRAESVLLVEQGSVLLERHERNGNILPISVCGRGAVVGLSAAILDRQHDVNATPRIDGEVFAVTAASVRDLTASPEHALLVARALATEASILAERCAALQSQTVRDRVLAVLAQLSDGAALFPVALALPMQELAALVGADLAHVCRVMRALRAAGTIDYGKRRLVVMMRIGDTREPGSSD